MHNPLAMGNSSGQMVLDQDITISILKEMPLGEVETYMHEEQ